MPRESAASGGLARLVVPADGWPDPIRKKAGHQGGVAKGTDSFSNLRNGVLVAAQHSRDAVVDDTTGFAFPRGLSACCRGVL